MEIVPLGYVYARAKLSPAPLSEVLDAIARVASASAAFDHETEGMPEFFKLCYSRPVLSFLLAARAMLDWKNSPADWTLMALILVDLHGDRGKSLSNQTRRSRAMAPEYSVAWWKKRGVAPPEIDPAAYLRRKVEWRYACGVPPLARSQVLLGDCRDEMRKLAKTGRSYDLVLTSPPYFGLMDYEYEQWLRLWLLGAGGPERRRRGNSFRHGGAYEGLLDSAFAAMPSLLRETGVVYVRTDARKTTLEATRRAMTASFPKADLIEIPRPFKRPTQTALFGDHASKPGEVDLVLVADAARLAPAAADLLGIFHGRQAA
jgi:hypothetical protein